MTEPTAAPEAAHPLDPDPPRPPGAPDVDLDIPTPDSGGAEGKPDNEDVPGDKRVQEPPD